MRLLRIIGLALTLATLHVRPARADAAALRPAVTIDGTPVIHDPGPVQKGRDGGTIHLTEGPHRIEVGQRNIAGGSYLHLNWKVPDSSDLELVPSNALIPDRAGT